MRIEEEEEEEEHAGALPRRLAGSPAAPSHVPGARAARRVDRVRRPEHGAYPVCQRQRG